MARDHASPFSSTSTSKKPSSQSAISQIRNATDLESDRQRMEYLASKRNELQKIIQLIQDENYSKEANGADNNENQIIVNNDNNPRNAFFVQCPWQTTSNMTGSGAAAASKINQSTPGKNITTSNKLPSSFFFMDHKTTENLLQSRLKETENELVNVCEAVQRSMELM